MNLFMTVNVAIWRKALCAELCGWSELLCDDKTKATNFLQLIALGIVNYSVFEITSLVAAFFRSL